MTQLNITAAKQAIETANASIAQLKEAQETLNCLGLLEAGHMAQIPATPSLYDAALAMAQKAIEKKSFYTSESNYIDLRHLIIQTFREAGKSMSSTSDTAMEALLSTILDLVNGYEEDAKGLVSFLSQPKINSVRRSIKSADKLTSWVLKDSPSMSFRGFYGEETTSQNLADVMALSDLTQGVTASQIKASLIAKEDKTELYTVKPLKEGVKFQLSKNAAQAIKAQCTEIVDANDTMDALTKVLRSQIIGAIELCTDNALTPEAYKEQLIASRLNKRVA